METIINTHNESEYREILQQAVAVLPWGHINHLIKYIEDEIYEFRVNYGNNEFRIFFIYDGERMVILFNAFKKKTQKTPQSEIIKAKRLKQEYYEAKNADIQCE